MSDLREMGAIDLTRGSPFRLLVQFSLPLLLGNALQQVYNLADSAIAGHFIGTTALSAVSNGYIIILMMTTIFSGFGTGGAVVVAHFFGQHNEDRIRRTVNTIYFGITIVAIPLTLLGWFGARPLLQLFQVPPQVLPGAVSYVRVIMLGSLGVLGYNINAGILNGLGDSKTSLKFLSVSCVVNVLMDLVFVAVFHLGVAGAALATALSQFISWLLGVRYINRRYSYLHISLPGGPLDRSLLKQILHIGIPSTLSSLQYHVGIMLLQSLINSFGDEFIAGVSAATRLEGFSFMPILSISSAITTFAAQNAGAGKPERIRSGVRSSILLLSGICILLAALVVPLAKPMCHLLFGVEGASLDAGQAYLLRVMTPSCLLGILYILNAALRGAGCPILPTLSGIIALWLIRVPAAYYLAAHYGPHSMFLAYPIGWICGLAISGVYYLSFRWMRGQSPRSGRT